MIVEIGHFALILALALAFVQSTVPLYGAARRRPELMEVAPRAAIGQFGFVLISYLALTNAYVTSDYSVLNVAMNSHASKPLLYRITGVWANHEGSLLLWILILTLFGMLVALRGRNLPPTLRARVLAVQGMIAVGFMLFTLLTSNPFERAWPPPQSGSGLNPLLQDPGLAFHPPFLYFGYVGFSITFAFAVAALLEGRVDPAWGRWVRPWALAAWCGLTVGIALGSWWAYYELGWGGFWFWDPVENASLMPWLVGTALLHSAIVVEKRAALRSWTILLAILTFSLSLIGTFLVRSGVLTSVHAFAQDPDRGVFILLFLVIAIGGALALYAWRAPSLRGGGLFQPVSREGAMLLNNLFLAAATATVFLGTLYPLFLDVLGGGMVSVGPPYFNATFGPLMAPVLVAMAVGPMLAWKRGDLPGALSRLWLAFILALLAVVGCLVFAGERKVVASLGIGVAVWLITAVIVEWGERVRAFRAPLAETWRRACHLPRATYGMSIAHLGVGLVVLGIMASTAWQTEVVRAMQSGDSVDVAGYTFTFQGMTNVRGPNYIAERGVFEVERDGRFVAELHPERRFYTVERQSTTQVAIHTTWLADLYAVIGESNDEGARSARLYHNPLVPWIWLGAIVMAIGGVVSLTDRRHRVGVPARRRAEGRAAPAPAE